MSGGLDNRGCDGAHDWHRTNEGGWRRSFEPGFRKRRPVVAVEVVWCARCDACVDMPVELAAALPLHADNGDYAPGAPELEEGGRDLGALWRPDAVFSSADDDDIPF